MKEILSTSFLSTLDEPLSDVKDISNKEFYSILTLIGSVLTIFAVVIHVF